MGKNNRNVEKYPCDRCGKPTKYDEDDHRTMSGEEILCGECSDG